MRPEETGKEEGAGLQEEARDDEVHPVLRAQPTVPHQTLGLLHHLVQQLYQLAVQVRQHSFCRHDKRTGITEILQSMEMVSREKETD